MAYVNDPNSLRVISFQYVPMVSDRMRGLSGLGATGDKVGAGEEVTLSFTQISGVTPAQQPIVLQALRVAVLGTNHFNAPSYLGWGAGPNAGKIVFVGTTRSSNYSVGQIAGFMPHVAQTVDARLGKHYLTAAAVRHGSDSVSQDTWVPPPPLVLPPPPPVDNLPHAYVTLSVCDAQRSLIAAGKNIKADGDWGPGSQTAFQAWVSALPYEPKFAVMGLSSTGSLPVYGAREDYKMDGTKLRIPAAYHRLLPAPARVACTGSAVAPRPPTVAPDEPDGGHVVSPGTGEQEDSGPPWVIIGVASAFALVVAAVLLLPKKKKTDQQSPGAGT
jgi:hypothetical protein